MIRTFWPGRHAAGLHACTAGYSNHTTRSSRHRVSQQKCSPGARTAALTVLAPPGQQAARGPRQRGTGRGTLAGGGCSASSCNRCNPRQQNPWLPSGCPRHVPARPRSSTAPKASERIVAGVGGRLRRLLSWRRLLCGRRLRGAPPGRRAVCLPRRRRLEGLLSAIRWRRRAMVRWRMLVLVVLYTGTPRSVSRRHYIQGMKLYSAATLLPHHQAPFMLPRACRSAASVPAWLENLPHVQAGGAPSTFRHYLREQTMQQ